MIYTLTLNPAVDRELTVPAFQFDTVLRADNSQMDIGGKGFNVSRVLKEFGAESIAVGFLGGKAGEALQEGLNALKIGTDFVWVEGETRTNISIVTANGGRYLKVNEKGPTIQPHHQRELLEKIQGLAHPGDWWVLAGSLPPGVPDSFYAQIITILNQHGAKALLDTSGEPLRLGCRARPFLIKPNFEETQVLTGISSEAPADVAQAARAIQAMGVENVVISMGKSGAFLQTEDAAWFVRSPKINEKNPIGAGDSMVAGFIWALTRGMSPQDSLGWGVASGAATASLSGTEIGSQQLIESLLPLIIFEPLEGKTLS
jgi:1-phosphofructokinase family hexose kinase